MEREAQRLGKRIVGDKSPSSTIHGQSVRDLHDVFPDAALVYIVRDGRDVLVSERFRNFVEESRFLSAEDRRILAELRREPASFGEGKRSIFTEGVVRRVAGGWAANLEEVDAEGRRLFRKKYLAMRYEDLLQDPEQELRRVWAFLGVRNIPATIGRRVRAEMNSNPDEEWQFRRGQDIASFLAKGKAGNWRSLLTARDKDVFKEVAGKALVRWRYERSGDW
jgi:hypothetical protein